MARSGYGPCCPLRRSGRAATSRILLHDAAAFRYKSTAMGLLTPPTWPADADERAVILAAYRYTVTSCRDNATFLRARCEWEAAHAYDALALANEAVLQILQKRFSEVQAPGVAS